MTISLTPQEFQTKLRSLRSKNPTLVENGINGTISNTDVTLNYSYDGIASLTVTIVQKHSLRAKLASAAAIERSLSELFAVL